VDNPIKGVMEMPFRPMLAETCTESDVRFPAFASPKLDGLRGIVVGGVLRTRSMKLFTNLATHEFFSDPVLDGLDGELIVGPATAKDVFLRSTSGLRNRTGDPEAVFYVFDIHGVDSGFCSRLGQLHARVQSLPEKFRGRVVVLQQHTVRNIEQLLQIETEQLEAGYEGLILKHIDAPYKQGRSTLSQGWMLKLKRFADSEGVLLGLIEGRRNDNEAKTNELGFTARSTNKDNMVLNGTMGAMLLRDLKTGALFTVGTGYDIAQRAQWWAERSGETKDLSQDFGIGGAVDVVVHLPKREGVLIKYKYFALGYETIPRFPVFVGERLTEDMS
jgi:DNA ligase-1